MMKKQLTISYDVFHDITELSKDDAFLLNAAREATVNAYAPYSRFHVAAAARMMNGNIITGTNQENASFPAGICAERVLLSAVSAVYPGENIQAIAISYNGDLNNSKRPLAPCGICRQSLSEFESRFHQPVRLILGGMEGEIFIFSSLKDLLPLEFSRNDLEDNSRL
jgi:cytidine deaminase